MCEKDVYTELRPDGRITTSEEPRSFCNIERKYCERTKEYHHPAEQMRTAYNQYPPTPPMSSHSEYTSDSERSSKRSSGIYVNGRKVSDNTSDSERATKRSSGIYVNGRKVSDISRRRSSTHERQPNSDRLSYEGSSSLSRSPLRSPTFYQRSIPSSPAADVHDRYSSSYLDSVVDERDRPSSSHHPSIKVEIVNDDSTHRRKGSSSKTSSSRDSDEDERKHRRQRRASVHFEEPPKAKKEQRKQSEIARANDAIANRTAVPHTAKTPYRRGSVSLGSLVSATEQLRIDEDKMRRRQERELRKEREREDADQKKRLKDRMTVSTTNARRPSYYGSSASYYN
ncbi:hypothetical protein GGR57DRAFT_140726 [Xylariaceae sp. FL1272]|nr:hypothetical protein GGR57DRAFT_140726 [Xylariaceae sp. FL1272]